MKVFVARQPIFDRNQKVYAYELLYRNTNQNRASFVDGEAATTSVILNSYLEIGIDKIAKGKKTFINFTEKLIKEEIPYLMNQEKLVVEILEDVVPDEELVRKCKTLKIKGYTLALDDFVYGYPYEELIDLVDIIKVDFMLNSHEETKMIVDKYKKRGRKFLAEKIETMEEFEYAKSIGYDYFQGYFFSKPVILNRKAIKGNKVNYLRIIEEMHKKEPSYSKIAKIVEADISLTYKVMKLVNNMMGKNKIKSVRYALVLLGLREVEKWVSLVILRGLNTGKPDELLILCLLRAKFGELIASRTKFRKRKEEIMLMGMFSTIDAIMDKPMADVLKEIPFEDDIKKAMLGDSSEMTDMYKLITSYEKASWQNADYYAERVGINMDILPKLYIEALSWCDKVFKISEE